MSQDKIYKIIGYSLEIITSLIIGLSLTSMVYILAGQPINWILGIAFSSFLWISGDLDIKVGPQTK